MQPESEELVTSEEVIALREEIERRLAKRDEDEWLTSLSGRKLDEIEFHDPKRELEGGGGQVEQELHDRFPNKKYYTTARASQTYRESWIRERGRGRVFLDYACGNGEQAVQAAEGGAALAIGLDITPGAIENAKRAAVRAGVEDRTLFFVDYCENTILPDSSVDAMLCSGMLHHLDLEQAYPEMHRILKPGGVCLAVEALYYNPLINLYRKRTPQLRTDWEKDHILSLADVRRAEQFFSVEEVRYWQLVTIAATPFRKTVLFTGILRVAEAVDSLLLRIPLLQRLAWMFSFTLRK